MNTTTIMFTDITNDAEQYVRMLDDLYRKFNRPNKYAPWHWLASFGMRFEGAKRPKGMRKERDHTCFRAAGRLAMDNPNYIYVEGYASNIIPVHHAWCVHKDNPDVAIDLVWRKPQFCRYFGLPIQTEFLNRAIATNKKWGLFFDMQKMDYSKLSITDVLHPMRIMQQ